MNTGAALLTNSADEILEIFRSLSKGTYKDIMAKLEPARKKLLAHWVCADGFATERVAKLALQMGGIKDNE